MCESNIYIDKKGKQELLFENAEGLKILSGGKIEISSMFGEKKVVSASIKEIDLHGHRIILQGKD